MSWLTDLTSKAENLLNKIDQSAAEKFHDGDLAIDSSSNAEMVGEISIHTTSTTPKLSPASSPTNTKPFSAKKLINAPLVTKSQSADGKLLSHQGNHHIDRPDNKNRTKKQDEMLFEFLNNTNNVAKVKTPPKPKLSTSLRASPVPSSSPLLGSRSQSPSLSVEINMEGEVNSGTDKMYSADDLTSVKVEDPVTEKRRQGDQENDNMEWQHERISNLELENQLLKNDVQLLNEELSRTLGQLKERQEETEKYKMRYENRRNQQNEDYERIRVEYQSKENDLQEALKAKDSQLAVLRVRIQEVDGELKEKIKLLVDVQGHNERLMKDHTDASGVQNVALDSIRQKLEETESQLSMVQQENEEAKSELMSLQEKLLIEQNQYVMTIKQMETKQNQEKEKSIDFELKVKQAADEVGSAQKELKDYKEKAARILQAKEKLISSLKQGNASDIPPMLLTELEEVKHERDMMREECNKYMFQTEQLKSDYQELELLHNTDLEDNQQKVESLQSSLQDETMRRQHLEEDMKRYVQELQFSKEELHKIRKTHVAENQQHEDEIKKLKNQISLKQNISSSQEELENRIRTLTDSLIHKQTVVETLSTEKNSLVLQLERLEKQYYDIQKSLDNRNRERNSGDVDDLDRGVRLQSMQSILPSKVIHNRHWKSTANEIDKFSVRLGVFLRRYPAARLMVIIYMLILHIWVTFVLLTYTPEIHPKEP